MEQALCEAAIKGSVGSLHQILGKDALILDKIVVGCFNGTSPLHVAVLCGQTQFVEQLLTLKPKLAQVLDSQLRSALHLAAAEGHMEILKVLMTTCPEMCLAPDREGRNPLHIAAIKGQTQVLEELVRTNPKAARARVDRDETILHLCVKHSQFDSLKKLLEMIRDKEFVDAQDNDGNTILHLAVLHNHVEVFRIRNQGNKKIKTEVDTKNASGHTAMDIFCLHKSVTKGLGSEILDFLREANAKRAKDLTPLERLTKKKDSIMIVASLIATMAFQAGVNPPGGVWQEDSSAHRAGEAVMAYNYPDSYPYFLRSNTIGLVASLSTILLLISGISFKKKAYMWALIVIMWVAITSMAFTYAFSNVVVTPKKDRAALSYTIEIAVIVWCSVIAVVLLQYAVRSVTYFIIYKWKRHQAMKRISPNSKLYSRFRTVVTRLGVQGPARSTPSVTP